MSSLVCWAQPTRSRAFLGAAAWQTVQNNSGGGSDVAKDSVTGTTTSSPNINIYASSQLHAVKFIAASSYTAHSITVRLNKVGSPTGNLTCYIYTNSANLPSSVITGGTSGTVAANTLLATEADVSFTGLTASIISGGTYYVAIGTSMTADGVNYQQWGAITCTYVATGTDFNYNGSAWSIYDTGTCDKFTIYGQ